MNKKDLAVARKLKKKGENISLRNARLRLQHNIVIAPVVFSREAVQKGPLSASPLYKVIQKEGILV